MLSEIDDYLRRVIAVRRVIVSTFDSMSVLIVAADMRRLMIAGDTDFTHATTT